MLSKILSAEEEEWLGEGGGKLGGGAGRRGRREDAAGRRNT